MRGSKATECMLHRILRCMHLHAGACATSSTFCIRFRQVGVCFLASFQSFRPKRWSNCEEETGLGGRIMGTGAEANKRAPGCLR